jgi:hypothetical protein
VALVLFLRGVNVGGRRIFRPSALAAELAHLGAINIGAAGTFVIRGRISREGLRAELTRRLPFVTGMVICDGRDILKLTTRSRFAGAASRPGTVRFVSVLVDRPLATPALPLQIARARPLAAQDSGARWTIRVGRLSPRREGDRLSRQAGPALRRARHDSQLEYHHGDRQGLDR